MNILYWGYLSNAFALHSPVDLALSTVGEAWLV